MPNTAPTREDTWLVSLSIDGRDLEVWDTLDGGEIDSDESKYRPGGMSAEISLGGTRTIGNITLGRNYDYLRDHPMLSWLVARVGAGRCVIGRQPLDLNRIPQGSPTTYTGTLKTVTPPGVDSMSNDAAVIELEITIDGTVS
jgi:hypothetical protein